MGEAGGQVDVGEYERQRLQHIRRNREEIMRLGVSLIGYSKPSTSTSTSTSARGKGVKNSKKRQRDKGEVRLPTRKSSRLLGKEAEYASDDLEVLVKLEEEEGEERKGIKREKEKRNIIEISTQWLEESRKALLQVRVESSGGASSNGKWRKEAERRWGHGVVAAEAATSNLCWKTYVTSRLSKPPPPSPLELVQEFYAHDPWRLLVCCILMSRVSSWETKHNAISSFFKAYPTPTDMHNADPKECLSVIHPLGLFVSVSFLFSLHFVSIAACRQRLRTNIFLNVSSRRIA